MKLRQREASSENHEPGDKTDSYMPGGDWGGKKATHLFGSPSKLCRLTKTPDTPNPGDHISPRTSRQILPAKSMFGWKMGVRKRTSGGL